MARIGDLFRPRAAEDRAAEEFKFHVEMETARLRGEGVPPDEARRQALSCFGGVERYRQEMRDGRGTTWLSDLRGDLRYGARMLRKHKGLTFVAIASLAIGIGANSAIFSLANAILLRPRAVASPEQLVQVYGGDEQQPYQTVSYPSYLDLRERNGVFTDLAAYGIGFQFRLGVADDVEMVWGEPVSANYFTVLGVRALLGRMLSAEQDERTRNPVVVIGHDLWQRQFNSDSTVIGRTIRLNSQFLTVIGVAPSRYTGMMNGWATEVWVPAMLMASLEPMNGEMLSHRGSKWVTLVGRLKPGISIDQARARFDLLTRAMQAEHPDEWLERRADGERETVLTLLPETDTRVHPAMRVPALALTTVLFVVVNLVLVIACLNLAGMLFARGIARRGEIGVRLALGARRSRIVRQLLAESLLLALVAGATGIVLANWALGALLAFMPALPEGIRLAADLGLDWRVVAFTVVFSLLTGVLFGLAPALHATREALSSVMKDDAAAIAGQARTSLPRRLLIPAQVAFSLLLLLGAGLMWRSLDNVRPTRLGFNTVNMIVAPLSLDHGAYDRLLSQRFFREVSENIAALPGVQAVSMIDAMPGGALGRTRRSTEIEGYTPGAGERLEIDAALAGPRYFTNLGIPVVQGQDFDDRDAGTAPCVAIINEAFVQRYLPGRGSVLGTHLTRFEGSRDRRQSCAIVGVVRDGSWQSLQRDIRPFFWMPAWQSDERRMTLLVHTSGNPEGVVPGVRSAIRSLDADMPLADVQTLDRHFGAALLPFRALGLVVFGCGLLALLLATMGIYGTVAYSVAQRRREVGIRMAMGAAGQDILRMLVGQGMALVVRGLIAGLLLGAALAGAVSRLPVDLLFGIQATDVATFTGVTALLAVVALTACIVPAFRATRIDPAVTLRSS
jgi:predicted permease